MQVARVPDQIMDVFPTSSSSGNNTHEPKIVQNQLQQQQQQQQKKKSNKNNCKESSDEDDEDGMSVSPHAVTTLFRSSRPHRRPSRESVLQRLSEALLRRSLTKIDLSQRGLMPSDARLVKMALLQNRQLTVLKLGYNNLGDAGACILADGDHHHHHSQLQSLDLGFNNIGDVGCAAVAASSAFALHTLYLAGNLIGEQGALCLADMIGGGASRTSSSSSTTTSCSLQKLYLTGNLLGPDGVKAITEAILEGEGRAEQQDDPQKASIQEIYLGGSGMGAVGCQAVGRLLRNSVRLRVLSLPNCGIGDDSVRLLAESIKANRTKLPLESLQLSFNQITCKGIETLANAVWGSTTLKELLLDNNEIGDRGAQHIAAVLLPHVKTMEALNVGFNMIKAPGIKTLMKVVKDSTLQSLSISGNTVDTDACKSIAYALAYNRSLTSLSLVHCKIGHEGQRHISAGIVSNSRIQLNALSGFSLGPVIGTLGFPATLERWNNSQIFSFLKLMWDHHRDTNSSGNVSEDEEKMTDPLNFLGNDIVSRSAPLEATIVVEVAKKAFTELVADRVDVFARGCANDLSFGSPIVGDDVMLECAADQLNTAYNSGRRESCPVGSAYSTETTPPLPARKNASFVARPEAPKQTLPDPNRKKRIVAWLSANIKDMNRLAEKPFNASDLWKLHQHYFTPVVNESGGEYVSPSPNSVSMSSEGKSSDAHSLGRNCMDHSLNCSAVISTLESSGISSASDNTQLTFPILKRKVSYRFLGEAAFNSAPKIESTPAATPIHQSVSMTIEASRPSVNSMPPKNKRARRNRSRISFLPRIKAKLDALLVVSHDKALLLMRQLMYVEKAILGGHVNPIDATLAVQTHLCADCATDAEMIVADMI